MDAATLAPIRSLASRLCSLSDTDATFAQLVASGRELAGAAYELARICAPGGEADTLAAKLDDPAAAAQYVREIVETFAPFAAILPAVEVTAPGEQWVLVTRSGYTKVSAAEARRMEKRRREKELRKACDARFVVTYTEAARRIGVPVPTAHNYAHLGKLVAVYPNGRRKAVGVTRASLDAYIERRDLRRNAAKTRANELVARREERERTGGTFYTDRGETIVGSDRITAAQAATLYGLTEKKLHTAAKRGKVARVYVDAKRNHPVGRRRRGDILHRRRADRRRGAHITERSRRRASNQRAQRFRACSRRADRARLRRPRLHNPLRVHTRLRRGMGASAPATHPGAKGASRPRFQDRAVAAAAEEAGTTRRPARPGRGRRGRRGEARRRDRGRRAATAEATEADVCV